MSTNIIVTKMGLILFIFKWEKKKTEMEVDLKFVLLFFLVGHFDKK